MRGSRLFALLPFFALATACGDEGGGAFVEMSTTWQVFCTSGACTFQPHVQNEKVDFKVSCSRDSFGLTVNIEAGPDETTATPTPGGTLSIARLNPATGSCAVKVTDTQTAGGNQIQLSDTCAAAGGGCTVSGALDSNGWDFAGTIKCDRMTQGTVDNTPYLLRASGMTNPVDLKVDCG